MPRKLHIPSVAVDLLLISATVLLLCPPDAGAISSRTALTPTGAAAGDFLGYAVTDAGDVNGDGYADVIVGAPLSDVGGANAGQAYLYYGGPGADTTADLTFTGGAANDQFGTSVGAGDVNGDGYADVIVGAPLNDAFGANSGIVYVYHGGPGMNASSDLTILGAAAGDQYGFWVAGAGDVNGDGYEEMILGAPLNDGGGSDAGRAQVYYGGPSPSTLTFTGAAGDNLGSSVAGAGDVNGDGYADVIVGAQLNDAGGADAGRAYVFYGGPGADATADLTLTGAAAGDNFGTSVSGAGDVNGDGYADVIAGARNNDAGGADAGRAYVYYGGPGADATSDLTLTGAVAADNFGASVSGAGDVNEDGFADVLVGAPLNDSGGANAGRVYAYYGGSVANTAVDLTLTGAAAGDQFGNAVSGAGDMTGDGFADVIAGANLNDTGGADAGRAYVTAIYPYQVLSPNGGEQWVVGQPATVGWRGHDAADLSISVDGGLTWSVLAAGVGGEAENEVVLTAPPTVTDFAKVRVSYTGQSVSRATSDESDRAFRISLPVSPPPAASRLKLTLNGAAAFDGLGTSVSGAGDVNGDGYADVIVGGGGNDAGGADAGRAYVYYGGPGADATADLTLTGVAAGDNFGGSVSGAGDVNGDGYADVIVGAQLNDAGGADAGRAYVYYGGPGADATADLTLTGAAANDFFGSSVSGAGDVNGDAYTDLIVGAYGNDTGGAAGGRAYVYFGGVGADATADLVLTGAAGGDNLGISVSGAGDVNGDGYADVIVGGSGSDAGGTNAGRAYVYYGGAGADATADLVLTGAAGGDNLGNSVSEAGDVNGDGYADVIVGAQLNDAGGADAGRAYVYYGGPGADATADLVLTGAAASDLFGHSVAGAGDVNGDGNADVIVGTPLNDEGANGAGRAHVYYGGPGTDATADLIITGTGTNHYLGVSVAAAGDVNGDGFADVIVGEQEGGGINAGRAYLYDFNRYFVLSPNDDEVWNVGAGQSVSWMGAERADLWLSPDGGNRYELLLHDVGGHGSNTVNLLVPHVPTKFARVKVTPADLSVSGVDESDSLFTIQASIALLNLAVTPSPDGGVELQWTTDPGPEDLAGYTIERSPVDREAWRVVADHLRVTSYHDKEGGPGQRYRLIGINGLGEELVLGEAVVSTPLTLSAWPLPYRGGDLTVTFLTASGPGGGSAPAEVDVFDLQGRVVRELVRGDLPVGVHTVSWDGRDDMGRSVAEGVYFLREVTLGAATQLKLVVVR